jgi:hypothetical protein
VTRSGRFPYLRQDDVVELGGCSLIVGSAARRAVREQDSGILNVTLENLGSSTHPSRG